ncbi:MAG: 50S ribosomal protein L23 [Gammaproteobacteria bacterium]
MSKDIFQVIERPYLTEKVSGLIQDANQYAFKVNPKSSKLEIKKAIESFFSVKVVDVNVLRMKGKVKRSRYRLKKRADWKKAYVRLAEGESIEVGIETNG